MVHVDMVDVVHKCVAVSFRMSNVSHICTWFQHAWSQSVHYKEVSTHHCLYVCVFVPPTVLWCIAVLLFIVIVVFMAIPRQ